MTYITYADLENRMLLVHKFPCEKIGNLNVNRRGYQEFSKLDYAENYAEEKKFKVIYCKNCLEHLTDAEDCVLYDENLSSEEMSILVSEYNIQKFHHDAYGWNSTIDVSFEEFKNEYLKQKKILENMADEIYGNFLKNSGY